MTDNDVTEMPWSGIAKVTTAVELVVTGVCAAARRREGRVTQESERAR